MDIREKLILLGQAAQFDDRTTLFNHAPADDAASAPDLRTCISHVQAPGGRSVPVLKVLQTSVCQNDCHYCAFRATRDVRRGHFTPDELARGFDLMRRAGLVEGMFLSSGVAGTVQTMDQMLATAELLRLKYEFRGYLHLKLLPDSQPDQVTRAVELADRVSTNLEAPTAERLALLAPRKQLGQLLGPLRAAADVIRRDRLAHGSAQTAIGRARLGMSTQFVVGPAGETDRELLGTVQMLYREVRLARAYYSAFRPIPNTPLANAQPTDPRREYRLYQADWLLRYYGFAVDELPFEDDGLLSARVDPKTAWARAHPERFPIEINQAPTNDLLRVPGIGPISARAIIQARRQGQLRSLGDLRRLGARADQAAPYVLLAGQRPPWQLPLTLN
jgi:predicted DNA-binding helix-hairpin-helix protein